MADPTFVELADVLASGDITNLQIDGPITATGVLTAAGVSSSVNVSGVDLIATGDVTADGDVTAGATVKGFTLDAAKVAADAVTIDASLSFPTLAGNIVDRSNVILHDDGYMGLGPPVTTVVTFLNMSDNSDVALSGTTTVLTGTTTDSFTVATEEGNVRINALINNGNLFTTVTATFSFFEDGAPIGDTFDIALSPNGATPVSFTDDLDSDILNGATIRMDIAVSGDGCTLLGSQWATSCVATKQTIA